jgi:hypothetical protein
MPHDLCENLSKAKNFISQFTWCNEITDIYLGYANQDIIYVFLFNLKIRDKYELFWVIVGDLPSAYIVTDCAKKPWEAVDAYFGEIEKWIAAVRSGSSVKELMPINASPNMDSANLLQRRIDFIDRNIMPDIKSLS